MYTSTKSKSAKSLAAMPDTEAFRTSLSVSDPPPTKFGYVLMDPKRFSELPHVVTINEAAERLKHCKKWVKKQLRELQIPILMVGHKMLIPEAHLVMFYVSGPLKNTVILKKDR